MDDSKGNSSSSGPNLNEFRSGIIRKTEYFDLFISYKRDNGGDHGQQLAERLYKDLTRMGFKIWLDNEQIGFSRDFEKRIEEAILHSKKFAAILSPKWLESENCRYEYIKSLEFEKRIIPIHYREFRNELRQQKDDGILSESEWRCMDKPQEINFSEEAYYQNALKDLAAICKLKDDITKDHTRILCESYYWKNFDKPDGVLLRGTKLTKTKRLKKRCDGDEESPSFSQLQNEFLDASSAFVSSENTRKRNIFLNFSEEDRAFAVELDLELRINNISTWFDEYTTKDQQESAAIEAIINCESVINVANSLEEEEDLKVAYARANNKRVIQITRSKDVLAAQQEGGESNIYLWKAGSSLDAIITIIKGDASHVASHAELLEKTIIWENADKADNKLLVLKEAKFWKEWIQNADKEKSDPPPTTSMFDFIERGAIFGTALARRKRMVYWTTLIGIILLVAMTAGVLWLNNKVNNENIKLFLLETQQIEQKLKSNFKQKELDLNTKQQQKRIELIKAKSDSLNNKLLVTEKIMKQSQVTLDSVMVEAIAAKQEADSSLLIADRAQEDAQKALDNLGSAKAQLAEVEKTKLALNNFIQGNRQAIAAYQDIRFQQDSSAAQKADTANQLLADAGASSQIQPLYEVGKQLVADSSGFSQKERQNPQPLDSLMKKMNRNPADLFPAKNTQLTQEERAEIIQQFGLDGRAVAMGRKAPSGKITAIAYKNGAVDLLSLDDTTIIEQYRNHSHRITDVVFNKAETFMCVASIDNTFSVIPVDRIRRKFGEAEILEETSDMRITDLYFLDNDIVIGVSKLGARAWGIDVNQLLKMVANEN